MKFSTLVILAVAMTVSAAPIGRRFEFNPHEQGAIDSIIANLPAPTPLPIDLGDISFGHLPELPPSRRFGFPAVIGDELSSLLANLPAPTPAPVPIDLGDISFGHLPELPPSRHFGFVRPR